MLTINELTVTFPSHHGPMKVLDRVNLQIEAGEKLGIVGESGSGKTSLALTLMGLSPGEVEGSITFHGKELLDQSSREWESIRGGSLAMVRQQSGEMLTPVLSLGKQVEEPYLKQYPGRQKEARQRAMELLREVGLGEEDYPRYPYTMSGGEVQRALLAMALITDPQMLILDEPVSSLDALTKEDILQLLSEVTADCTVLIISHDLTTVARLAHQTAVLYSGMVLEKAPTHVLFSEPRHPYSRALVRAYPTLKGVKELQGIRGEIPSLGHRPGGCPFHPRCTQALDICTRERPAINNYTVKPDNIDTTTDTAAVTARDADKEAAKATAATTFTETSAPAGTPADFPVEAVSGSRAPYSFGRRWLACHRGGIIELLRGEKIFRRYPLNGGYLEAVQGVDLHLNEGEVYSLVGESGSGKTTLGRILAGVDAPDEGEVYFQQRPLNRLSPQESRQSRQALQMLFQNSGEALSHRLNVYDLVVEPLQIQGLGDAVSRRQAVEHSLEWVRLPRDEEFLHRYPHHLSGGELQRVALARALVLEPRVLVADEPSASLDASVQAKVIKLLLHLQNEKGFALILITHDLALAARAGDRIGVMHRGVIIEEGPSTQLVQHPGHPYTRRLLQAAPSLETF